MRLLTFPMLLGLATVAGSALAQETTTAAELRHAVLFVRRQDLPVHLGPAGATGYVCRHWFVVRTTLAGAPAHGVLREHDIVVGANGRRFAEGEDPRRVLGETLAESESPTRKGVWRLAVLRDGEPRDVTIRLPVRGALAPSWPWSCAKSERVLADACRYLADNAHTSVIATGMVPRAWNALLLLASGDLEHLDVVRRAAYRVVDDPLTAGYTGWSRSFAGILLAEYYLATGDRTVLPKLRDLGHTIAVGQMACGSWGHRMPWGGYGAVNQIGLACFAALVLIRECGVEVDPKALETSTEFFRKYAGRGFVPYGDHRPWLGNSGNGKNAAAAVVFDLLGVHAKESDAFGRSVAASYAHREEGHTGAFFSFAWGPLGAARAPEGALRRFLDEQRWYYDLARVPGGGLVCQPNPENLSGRTPGVYTRWGAPWTTGGMAMLYALPRKSLRILGGPPSVFGTRHSEGEAGYARRLLAARERREQSVVVTLEAAAANARKGDWFTVNEQLAALRRMLGEERPSMRALAKKLASEEARKEIEIARDFHAARGGYRTKARPRRRLQGVARRSKGYYGRRAAQLLAAAPPLPRAPRWEDLLPRGKTWRFLKGETGVQGFFEEDFDDDAWSLRDTPFKPRKRAGEVMLRRAFRLEGGAWGRLRLLASCPPGTEVWLNGHRVAEIVLPPRKAGEPIPLRDRAATLLRRGDNVVAVRARPDGRAQLDFRLQGARRER